MDSNRKCNTDDQHKHECERKYSSDPQVITTAKIMHTCKIKRSHAFVYDKVPIVDLGTLTRVIMVP